MSIGRVKVELRDVRSNASEAEKDRAFKAMFATFKRRVIEAGIIAEWKEHQYYESKSEKKRRKKKESALLRQKEKLRDYFQENPLANRKKNT